MEAQEKEGRLYVSGVGIAFLRLKSSISRRVGPELVRAEGRECFSLPMESLGLVVDLISTSGITQEFIVQVERDVALHGEARRRALTILDAEDEGTPIPPWDAILDPHQAVAVNVMTLLGLKGVCIFDEQGSGKTVMALAAFDVLKRGEAVDQMIVVCPKSMMSEWPKDIVTFLKNNYTYVLVEGSAEERRRKALDPVDILIVNYDAVPLLSIALRGAAGRRRTLLVVDESYYVKNPDAIRSGAIRELRRRCVRAFVLCGTPAPNSAADIVHQFDVADEGFTFGGFRPSGEAERDKTRITEAVRSRGTYVRRLKSKVLPNLPEKSFMVTAVDLVGRQAQLYHEAREKLVLWLRTMDNQSFQRNLVDYFARRQVLLQICSCPSEVDKMYTEVPAKLLALDELLQRLVEREGRKVVLWSYYRKSIDEAAARYRKYGLVRIDGSTARNERTTAVSRFQGDPSVRIFLGNPAAAGAGITLHAAADAVYISYPSQAAHFLQSIDRIHRRGQTALETFYHLLICRGTIEEGEVTRLRHKEIEQHDLLGDEIPWPSSIDNALAELSGGTP